MRYLLTVIMVLALAAPAMSDCTTPDKQLGPYDDDELNKDSSFTTTGCDSVDWVWEFTRTDKTDKPGLTIFIYIDDTDFYETCISKDYEEGYHSKSGTDRVTSSTNTMWLSKGVSMESGYFDAIKLEADYRQNP